jgi:hypothetical protein
MKSPLSHPSGTYFRSEQRPADDGEELGADGLFDSRRCRNAIVALEPSYGTEVAEQAGHLWVVGHLTSVIGET